MKKISLISSLLFVFSLSITAQDMLITTKGDTIKGRISVFKNRQGVEQITMKVNKKKQQFRLLDVKRYFKKGVAYKTIFANGMYRIGRIVSEGYLSEYLYSPTSHDPRPPFSQPILIKESGDHIEVPKALGFRKNISQFLSDCPVVSERVNDKAYSRDQLALIVRDYNNCIVSKKSELEKKETLESKITNLREVLKESNKVENKPEVRQMLNDLEEKVKAKETIPGYLKTALSNAMSRDLKLSSLLQQIFDYK